MTAANDDDCRVSADETFARLIEGKQLDLGFWPIASFRCCAATV